MEEKQFLECSAGERALDTARITSEILDLGQMMLRANAEVSRVEDTISRLGRAYGFRRVEVLTIMSSIVVTIEDSQGRILTQTRRVLSVQNDMERVRACNALSRRICRTPLTEAALHREIEALRHTKTYASWQIYLIYMLTASSMAMFFGGSFRDSVAAAIAAVFMRGVMVVLSRTGMQNFVTSFLCSFAVGVAANLLVEVGLGENYDKIAMGNIMLLISGSGLMTSIRDMINNDLISGMMGFVSATVGAAAIALGFVTAFALFL